VGSWAKAAARLVSSVDLPQPMLPSIDSTSVCRSPAGPQVSCVLFVGWRSGRLCGVRVAMGGQALAYSGGAGVHISCPFTSWGSLSWHIQCVIWAPCFGGRLVGPSRCGAGGAGTRAGGSSVSVGDGGGDGRCCSGCSPFLCGGVLVTVVCLMLGWLSIVLCRCRWAVSVSMVCISHRVMVEYFFSDVVRASGSRIPHSNRSWDSVHVHCPVVSSVCNHSESQTGPNCNRLSLVGYVPGHHQGSRM
jgi:hypothetical protein